MNKIFTKVEREPSSESKSPVEILKDRLIRSYRSSLDLNATENLLNSFDDVEFVNAKKASLYAVPQNPQPPHYLLLSDQISQQIEKPEEKDRKFWLYLKSAIDEKNGRGDQQTSIDNAISLLNIDDSFHLNIHKLTFVAKTQKALGMNYQRTVDVLYQTMESFFSEIPADADPDDEDYKLERVEAIISMEDTIGALIEIGNVDQAKRLLDEYSIRAQGFDDEDFMKRFTVDSFVEIVRRESQGALTQAEIENIDGEQIKELASSKNAQILEALGYFNLIDEEAIEGLNDESKISVTIGKSKKKTGENLDNLNSLFQRSGSLVASKALTRSLTHLDRQELKNKIKDLLEISRNNPPAFRRLLKGLLEAKDIEGKKIATELFLSDETQDHFKLYLAKKLCGLGVWDRQINFYFRGIQKDTANIDKVHTDTLKAMITQMHLTPSLPIYKILEKTRQEKNGIGFDEMAHLGAKIFSHTSLTLETKLGVFSRWSEEHVADNLNENDLGKLVNTFEHFRDVEGDLLQSLKLHKEDRKTQYLLRELYTSRGLIDEPDKLSGLINNGIYPTEKLMALLKQNNVSMVQLKKLQKLTDDGQFDHNDPIQKEMEFLNFVRLNDELPDNTRDVFEQLPFYEQKEIEKELSLREKVEAEAAAFEAANVYWMIRERVEAGRKVSVVGNQRYGDYFVMEPLRSELQELGVNMSSFKIGSSGSSETNLPDIFPPYFIDYIAQERPDLVIIDGTARFKDGKIPRLPSSFYGYLNWFKLYNQQAEHSVSEQEKRQEILGKIKSANPQVPFRITYWTPQESKEIIVGSTKLPRDNPDYNSPNVIFANPIIDPGVYPNYPDYLKEHQPAFLDDPERHIGNKKIIACTPYGIKTVVEGSISEMQFASSIQNHMIKKLPRFIRETDPVFKS